MAGLLFGEWLVKTHGAQAAWDALSGTKDEVDKKKLFRETWHKDEQARRTKARTGLSLFLFFSFSWTICISENIREYSFAFSIFRSL